MAECVLRVISFPRKNVFAALMVREASPVVPLWKVADCRRSENQALEQHHRGCSKFVTEKGNCLVLRFDHSIIWRGAPALWRLHRFPPTR